MSFDIPLHIADNSPEAKIIEAMMNRDHISPCEAVLKVLRNAPIPSDVLPLTEEEQRQVDEFFPAFKFFDDVTDEQWERMLEGAREMNRDGFPDRG